MPGKKINIGISFVQCRECGRRGFMVWNEASARDWLERHAKTCRARRPAEVPPPFMEDCTYIEEMEE